MIFGLVFPIATVIEPPYKQVVDSGNNLLPKWWVFCGCFAWENIRILPKTSCYSRYITSPEPTTYLTLSPVVFWRMMFPEPVVTEP